MADQMERRLEQRLRRAAAREGCRIVKSRRRDPRDIDYGKVYAVDVYTNRVDGGWGDLDEALAAWDVKAA